MNLLVTGGAGYIGSVCVEELLNAGHTVSVLDNLSEGHRSAVDPRAQFIAGDLGDPATTTEIMVRVSPEAILHFAGSTLVGESMQKPGKYFRNNLGNGVNLLEATIAAGVRKMIFSSTCAVYGVPERVPMTEDLPQRPINPYAESKWMFERLLQWYRQLHGLEFVALRYFNAAGASARFGEHHRVETHLIPNVLKIPLGQASACDIFGTDYATTDGTCVRDYVHIRDLALAHILALSPGKQGAFNLGTGRGYTVREVIQTCSDVCGQKIPIVERPRRPGDAPILVAAAEKARRDLGWIPRFAELSTIVASAWQWHQAHPHGYAD